MTNQYEFEGKTVDDAIADGLIQLGLSRDQVGIEILQKGSRGIFGIGSEPALVRLVPHSHTMAQEAHDTPVADDSGSGVVAKEESTGTDVQPATTQSSDGTPTFAALSSASTSESAIPESAIPESTASESTASEGEAEISEPGEMQEERDASLQDSGTPGQEDHTPAGEEEGTYAEEISRAELTEVATELLDKMINLMGFAVHISTDWQEPEDEDEEACLLLNVEGDDLGPLIGRNGETLSNIQYLLRLMINQRIREWRNIVVDIAGYKARRTEKITQLAVRMAQQVSSTGRSIALEPMPSNERRVIHMVLRDHPDVYTQSTGEAERRKVNIFPRHN